MTSPPLIYTIGHSTRTAEEFLELLTRHGIATLADVRRFPGSRRHPQFGRDQLESALAAAGIGYVHRPELGGRRDPVAGSPNTAWRNESFRAYADHMSTSEFARGIELLAGLQPPVVIMCAEAVPWRCHRFLLSDHLVAAGIEVVHILSPDSTKVHAIHPSAVRLDDHLVYPADSQQTITFPG